MASTDKRITFLNHGRCGKKNYNRRQSRRLKAKNMARFSSNFTVSYRVFLYKFKYPTDKALNPHIRFL